MDILKLAQELKACFETRQRDSGETIYILNGNTKPWMLSLVHEAHGDMISDNWRYCIIRECLDAIIGADGYSRQAFDSLEASVYTAELTAWLASRNDRYYYVDQAASEGLISFEPFSLISALGWGQLQEKREVLELVINGLKKELKNRPTS